MRADIHDGPEQMLQSEAGYIDARPLTASSAKPLATHGRTSFRCSPDSGHSAEEWACPFCAKETHALQQSSLRGRDASYLAPPAQIRTCGFPACGSHLGSTAVVAVCEPTPVSRLSGSEPGTCLIGPHSPWSLSFAPPTPPRIAPLCSLASRLL